ncbi:mannitol dehydrogenase [Rhodoferax koreense]|uniref:Mannitol dehydrogenase n=1 Tax=Rhodoferax koreensis TaxID=1842727 RepID=A0A1P8K075_9BURK|nr:mannitol dehydrogenase family protein [Rhodoferax koreense]APW39414.1 mannitol dehydrogenase [Rhodoferax koreense]
MALIRLHPDSLAALPAEVTVPRYDRTALRGGIVHLGVGAFQRAHLAVVNEAALHASGDLAWGIVGVSLRSPDTRDALAPQGGLYTVATRDADETGQPRESLQVIGNLFALLVAPEDPAAVLARIAHADCRIVSLTVTEKGYCHDPATLTLRWDDEDIRHDLLHAEAPRSAIGMLVRGLQLRRTRGLPPITLMSLDNLPANGHTLQGLVLEFAGRVDAGLRQWIAKTCTFPNSMVDRIVPRTTDDDRASIGARLGVTDAWPVLGEPFLDWAVEDRFVAGRPDWTVGGARCVPHAEPFEKLKLRMVNGTHSSLSYLGAMAGWATVDRAVAEPAMQAYLRRLMREEIEPTLPALPGLDLADYRERLLARYANPALKHQTRQIAMDGSQKLPQRLLGTVRDRLAAGRSVGLLALGVAAWMHYLRGVDEAGQAYGIQDPMAPLLAEALALALKVEEPAARAAAFMQKLPMFGDLAAQRPFVLAVAQHWDALTRDGVRSVLENL